jgi:hypothetical protein
MAHIEINSAHLAARRQTEFLCIFACRAADKMAFILTRLWKENKEQVGRQTTATEEAIAAEKKKAEEAEAKTKANKKAEEAKEEAQKLAEEAKAAAVRRKSSWTSRNLPRRLSLRTVQRSIQEASFALNVAKSVNAGTKCIKNVREILLEAQLVP